MAVVDITALAAVAGMETVPAEKIFVACAMRV